MFSIRFPAHPPSLILERLTENFFTRQGFTSMEVASAWVLPEISPDTCYIVMTKKGTERLKQVLNKLDADWRDLRNVVTVAIKEGEVFNLVVYEPPRLQKGRSSKILATFDMSIWFDTAGRYVVLGCVLVTGSPGNMQPYSLLITYAH